MARAATLVALVVFFAAGGSALAQREAQTFRTPSGNIWCGYLPLERAAAALRCEIRSGVKPLPPKPASCEFDWGAGYSLLQTGAARVLCISDTIADPRASVLAYGTTRQFGVFRCSSSTAGLRCTNATGHGFFLSRERSYTFRETARQGAFKSPTGNIVCGWYGPPGAAVECAIKSGLQPPPKAVVRCRDGDPVTNRLRVRETGAGSPVLCAGDPGPLLPEVQRQARVLAYGSTQRAGGITCESLRSGMKCTNRAGRGFFVGRGFWTAN